MGNEFKSSDNLDLLKTESAIYFIKKNFQEILREGLNLHRVSAPIFVERGTGIQDNLNGIEHPVSFEPSNSSPAHTLEIVHSLAKWKRMAIKRYGLRENEGIYTDMNAIRPSESDLSTGMHSIYVDQWDWELRILRTERTLVKLKEIVRKIYRSIKLMEMMISKEFSIFPILPAEIQFIHSEDLYRKYPKLSPREREDQICREYGAVFIIGIGGNLDNGKPHDGRAPDYDDWSTPTGNGYRGLNGDILFHNPVIKRSFEISSMGIRVDSDTLARQLRLTGTEKRSSLPFHVELLKEELPQTIGGGIGQSRLAMFFLRKRHIGEVQVGFWPENIRSYAKKRGICIL